MKNTRKNIGLRDSLYGGSAERARIRADLNRINRRRNQRDWQYLFTAIGVAAALLAIVGYSWYIGMRSFLEFVAQF